MKYSEQEMAALISEVETEFADFLNKAEEKGQEDLQKTEEVVEQEVEVAEEAEEVSEELVKTEGDLELDYDDEDYVEMDKLYHSMSKAEQEAHYKSLKKSLFDSEESIEKKEEIVETPEKLEKKEEIVENKEVEAKEVKEEKLEKSEIDILKEENDELKKSIEKLTTAMTKFVQKRPPQRKAITKIEYITKSEGESKEEKEVDISKLSKDEISARLNEKIRSGELKKGEKEAIDNYYLGEDKTIDSIKHLL